MKSRLFAISAASVLTATLLLTNAVQAGSKTAAPDTKATDIHGAPANTPGFGGTSAAGGLSPQDDGVAGGGIHNLDGAPGQGGVNTADDRPAGNMHGGLADNTGYSK